MLLHRVFAHHAGAKPGASGHWCFMPPQGQGRLDNPDEYECWYLARDAAGAIGEAFGNYGQWDEDEMFNTTPYLPGGRKTLGVFEVPDTMRVLDLDNAANLATRGLRPTQVIIRNLSVTQDWALKIFQEKKTNSHRKWEGVKWWSFQRPQWEVYGIWGFRPQCVDTERLDFDHPAVIDAAKALGRRLP
jgi:hypothetical protein